MPKVLVVDDNVVNREMLRVRLAADGHEVLEAENGVEGVQMAHSSLPDLILMDVMMPLLDGWSACRRLKNDLLTRGIKIFMVTALAEGEDPQSKDCGADGFISKPCKASDLREAVAKSMKLSPA